MAPLDEANLTAASHLAFIRIILAYYGQSPEHLRFLIGDNCVADGDDDQHPIGWLRSHRFNLATKRYWEEHEPMAAFVAVLRTLKNRAELRRHTPLTPLWSKATRWSSTFMMLESYVIIRGTIQRVDAVDDLVPKPAVHRRLVALVETLETCNSVCKELQEDTMSMSAVRVLLDRMTEIYPVSQEYLLPDFHIVHSPAFESISWIMTTEAVPTPLSLNANLESSLPWRQSCFKP
ncbi:hypothetical protein PR001_g4677 [Phytophthora rubi]|uniref:Uncharacterized protein n=1 Tax=Phytophthora rubi TaxID=129364 RepID=A0A6A3MW87_9STRA|nr:hypothetical protein PR002_g7323 [Phytophthora rubi]KAE9046188.1 hypothetical protein PR001_g4677 [Phytophthora rubi]